jgi:hypothetical protein
MSVRGCHQRNWLTSFDYLIGACGRAYEFRVMNWVVAFLSSTLLALVGDVNFPHRNKRQAGVFLLTWAG